MNAFALLLAHAPTAQAFCGAYVGEPGATITNETSQIILAREGTRTTLTMLNDFAGDPSDFALVIPVPALLGEDDVRTVNPELFVEAERHSGPREVAYTCEDFWRYGGDAEICYTGWDSTDWVSDDSGGFADSAGAWSVEIEAEFEAGEYRVVILSAEDSSNLLGWLQQNGYGVGDEARELLQESIDAGAYFLAAQVSYEQIPPDSSTLSPLQIGYESSMISLPIRLGALNSSGEQDLVVYGITSSVDGQLSIVNYPQAEVVDECLSPASGFAEFYERRLAAATPTTSGSQAHWVLEYAWRPTECDPCVDDEVMSPDVITGAGFEGDVWNSFFTRLRIRYSPEQATQDLLFTTTGLREQSQQRYIRYDRTLEDRFPLCDEDANASAFVEEPGSCDEAFARMDAEHADEWPCPDDGSARSFGERVAACGGCASRGSGSAPALALAALLGLVLRRRER